MGKISQKEESYTKEIASSVSLGTSKAIINSLISAIASSNNSNSKLIEIQAPKVTTIEIKHKLLLWGLRLKREHMSSGRRFKRLCPMFRKGTGLVGRHG